MTPISEGQIWWSVEKKTGYRIFEITETEAYLTHVYPDGYTIYGIRVPLAGLAEKFNSMAVLVRDEAHFKELMEVTP